MFHSVRYATYATLPQIGIQLFPYLFFQANTFIALPCYLYSLLYIYFRFTPLPKIKILTVQSIIHILTEWNNRIIKRRAWVICAFAISTLYRSAIRERFFSRNKPSASFSESCIAAVLCGSWWYSIGRIRMLYLGHWQHLFALTDQ